MAEMGNPMNNGSTLLHVTLHPSGTSVALPKRALQMPTPPAVLPLTKRSQNVLTANPTNTDEMAAARLMRFQNRPAMKTGRNDAAHMPKNTAVAMAMMLSPAILPSTSATMRPTPTPRRVTVMLPLVFYG